MRAWDWAAGVNTLSRERVFQQFDAKPAGWTPASPLRYEGRPDGATVDARGHYWVAMFEGGQLLRFAPSGERVAALATPVQCPTMPCFGGDDLRTLFVTSARQRPPGGRARGAAGLGLRDPHARRHARPAGRLLRGLRRPSMALQHIPPIQCLLTFEAVARLRHAGRAADELCVTPSAVSHRIRQLESHVGIKLFGRSDFSLTADGAAYLANVRTGAGGPAGGAGPRRRAGARRGCGWRSRRPSAARS